MLNGMITADKTITVQDFIALQSSDDITYFNFSITEYLNGYEMFITNLLYDYEEELEELVVRVKLTDLEKARYRYKPYLLAFDVYGSEEAKFIVMMLNNIIDPKEFDFDTIKLINKSDLVAILSRIVAVNDDYLNNMKSKFRKDYKNGIGNKIWTE